MKIKKSALVILSLALCTGTLISGINTHGSLEKNSNEQYCTYTAKISKNPGAPDRTFVRHEGRYELAKDLEVPADGNFYMVIGNSDLNSSNYQISNMLCALKIRQITGAFIFSLFFSFIVSTFFFTALYGSIKALIFLIQLPFRKRIQRGNK